MYETCHINSCYIGGKTENTIETDKDKVVESVSLPLGNKLKSLWL